jgi:hypothetical protein
MIGVYTRGKMKSILIFLFIAINLLSASPKQYGYALSTVIWDNDNIPVCWEDYRQSTSTNRTWVKNAVTSTWQTNSDLTFIGWGECASNSTGIRIKVEDRSDGSHTTGLGDELAGVANGMVLNFTYQNWNTTCKGREQYCSEVIAVHEFGHAIGFAHEQNRDDTPDNCIKHPEGSNGDTKVGSWDLYSVMNYCASAYVGNGELSDTDLKMLHKFYGSKTRSPSIIPLAFNKTVSGTLSSEQYSTHATRVYAKYYTFTLPSATIVDIYLKSSAVDTYLYLMKGLGRTGTIIQINDDEHSSTKNSKITKTLGKGTYTLEASTYKLEESGAYTIRVNGEIDIEKEPKENNNSWLIPVLYLLLN